MASQELRSIICVTLFMVKPYKLFFFPLFYRPAFSPCFSACSRVAMLHCSLNWQFPHGRASFSSTLCQGSFWWHHHCCHSHSGLTPQGAGVSRTAAQPYLVVRCPAQQCPPIRSPCSAALQLQIMLDDFILIAFSFIFLYPCSGRATPAAKFITSGFTQSSYACAQKGHKDTQRTSKYVKLKERHPFV